jgi:hypothetical protein
MQIYAGVGKVQSGHMTFMKYHHTKFVCGAGGVSIKKKSIRLPVISLSFAIYFNYMYLAHLIFLE